MSEIKRDDRGLYRVERGEKGRMGKVYLTADEEQALKEAEARKSVAPSRGQTATMQSVDTVGCKGARGRDTGPTGVGFHAENVNILGPLVITDTTPARIIPVVLEDEGRISLAPGKRLAQENVILIENMQRLANNLYQFGRIDSPALTELTQLIECTEPTPEYEESAVMTAGCMTQNIAMYLRRAYQRERNTAPKLVIGYHSAPVFTLLQYLMGMVYPEGDMMGRAEGGQLLHREESGTFELLSDMLTVYNNIQADLGACGQTLVGTVPAEVGGGLNLPDDFSIIEMVNGAIDLTCYLSQRISNLNELLEAQL